LNLSQGFQNAGRKGCQGSAHLESDRQKYDDRYWLDQFIRQHSKILYIGHIWNRYSYGGLTGHRPR